jgi:hypothetical protein
MQLTELDKRLQHIAASNWPQFVALIGDDSILAAKICLLRRNKATYGEICARLNVSKEKARYNCGKCEPDQEIKTANKS